MRSNARNIKGFPLDSESMALVKSTGMRAGIAPKEPSFLLADMGNTFFDEARAETLALVFLQHGHAA